MTYSLTPQVAIVTGAGRGLGAAIARTLAAAGARVVVNDINPDRAERVAAAVRAAGGHAIAVQADVSNKFQCVHLIETTRAEWGRLDIVVNNAAVSPAAPLLKMDEWDWQRTLDVNLKGTFFMSQLAGRVMAGILEKAPDDVQPRGGVIVNVASTAGVDEPLENRAAYAASKAAIVGFARECAREYAAYDIRVNTLCPAEAPPPDPQAVANRVLFFCTPDAADLTGLVVRIGEPAA